MAEHPFNSCPATLAECKSQNLLENFGDGLLKVATIGGRIIQSYGASVDSCFSDETHENLKNEIYLYLRGQQVELGSWIDCTKIRETCDPEKETCEWRTENNNVTCDNEKYKTFLKWKQQVKDQWVPMRESIALGFQMDYSSAYNLGNPLPKELVHPEEDKTFFNPAPIPPLTVIESQRVITESMNALSDKAKEICPDNSYLEWAGKNPDLKLGHQKRQGHYCERPIARSSYKEKRAFPSVTLLMKADNWTCGPKVEVGAEYTYARSIKESGSAVQFAACLTRLQIGKYASPDKVPKTMREYSRSLQEIFPYVDVFPDKSPAEEEKMTGITAILPNAFGVGYLDAVSGRRGLDEVKNKLRINTTILLIATILWPMSILEILQI